jgi:hypothetical protein
VLLIAAARHEASPASHGAYTSAAVRSPAHMGIANRNGASVRQPLSSSSAHVDRHAVRARARPTAHFLLHGIIYSTKVQNTAAF